MKELWKYMGNGYSINEYGVVKSNQLNRKEKIIKAFANHKGYLRVSINLNNIRKNYTVHNLVYKYFNGKIDKSLTIDHIDNNKLNNHYSNLQQINNRKNISKGKLQYNKSSKYTGVCWNNDLSKWQANITFNSKLYHIGVFDNEEDAKNAYIDVLENGKSNIKKYKHIKTGVTKRSRIINKHDIVTNNIIETYNSISNAAKKNNINRVAIGNACNGRSKTAGGFRWSYGL